MVSVRKVAHEGDAAALLGASFDHEIHKLHIHRRGVSTIAAVEALPKTVGEGRLYRKLCSVAVQNDRGYAHQAPISTHVGIGLCVLEVIPDHSKSSHPFVASSHVDLKQDYEIDDI